MSADGPRSTPTPWVSSLLGMVLVLVAALDVVALAAIGRAAWQRATLSQREAQMRREDPIQLQGVQREARELRILIATSREATAGALSSLPTDADVARYLADLHGKAAAMGVTVTELSPQATPSTAIPLRRFTFRAQGDWACLHRFLTLVAQTCPATGRLDALSLRRQDGLSELAFELLVSVRPTGAPITGKQNTTAP